MRRLSLTLLVPGLLTAVLGCYHFQHTAGVCDCDPPPTWSTLYNYPGHTRPAVPGMGSLPPHPPTQGPLGPPASIPPAPLVVPAPTVVPAPLPGPVTAPAPEIIPALPKVSEPPPAH
jgi:hypothetical protein